MIRFRYNPPPDNPLPYQHFSLEGDNERGFVLLAWNEDTESKPGKKVQAWFETLGEALNHCRAKFCISREDWKAPNAAPPVGSYDRYNRGRRKGEATVLNAENVERSERRAQHKKPEDQRD